MLSRFVFQAFLEEGEEIVLVFRRPLVFLLLKLLWRCLLWGGIAVAFYYLDFGGQGWIFYSVFSFFVYKILSALASWYTGAILLTNDSLVFVYWPTLFLRRVDRVNWTGLDEVQVERSGALAFFFNYGTLRFLRVSGQCLEEHHLSRPHHIARKVEFYREKFVNHKNFTEESTLKELLSQMVSNHVGGITLPPEFIPTPSEPSEPAPVVEVKRFEQTLSVEKELDDSGGIEFEL